MIDEKKLIEDIEKEFDGVCVYDVSPSQAVNDFVEIVDRQPKVGEWIPCSERLPDVEYISGKYPVKGRYLTCTYDGNMNVYSWCEGWNCYRHPNGSARKDYEITDIVAWMPLPEAYKGETE